MEAILSQAAPALRAALPSLAAACLLLLALPPAAAILWKRPWGKVLSWKPLLLGAAGFLLSARVLELGVHMVCLMGNNPVARFLNGSTPAYVIYGALTAGVFEECGRYLVLRLLLKGRYSREEAVFYGIGHGGVEVWAVSLLSMVSLLAMALVLTLRGPEGAAALLGLSGEVAPAVQAQAEGLAAAAAAFGPVSVLLTVGERLIAMAAHVAFTLIVACGVNDRLPRYLLWAVLAHAGMDLMPALYQRGAVGIWLAEGWVVLWTAALMIWAAGLYRRMPGQKRV